MIYKNSHVFIFLLLILSLSFFMSCEDSVLNEENLTSSYNDDAKDSRLGSMYADSNITKDVISKLNELREEMGLPDVNLSISLNEGASLHNKYMYQNNLLTHQQDPSNPFYNPVGANAGMKSILAGNVNSGIEALDLWLNSLYHRQYLLNPDLTNIGFNFQQGFATLNLGVDDAYSKNNITSYSYDLSPVVYPFDGQKNVPTYFDTLESPNPVPEYLSLPTGPFLTISFPEFNRIKKVNNIDLVDDKGNKIPITYFSMKNKDYVLAILPEKPLEYGTKYITDVDIEVLFDLSKSRTKNSNEISNYKNTWSFTTVEK